MKGYIQVYTGNGKGKTTAALGLALRAAGADKSVYFAQFVKGKPYSELSILTAHITGITLKQYGRGCFIVNKPTEEDIRAAQNGLKDVAGIIERGEYDLVVLDEACIALFYHLFTIEALLDILHRKPESVELVVTGRYAPQALIDAADLVTEMKEIKHYYTLGVEAREGIEY